MRPRSLLMTFFGAFLRRLGGWIAVADLIALMGDAGLDEQAVRSAVSRLKRRGVIAPERRGAAAGYRLTEHGGAILEAGDGRIFARPQSADPAPSESPQSRDRPAAEWSEAPDRPAAEWSEAPDRPASEWSPSRDRPASEWSPSRDRPPSDWLLVVFSVPEAERALRHRLRTRLAWLGLGSVGSAVWIGPAHVEPEVRLAVAELGLHGRVDLFRAAHAGFEPLGAAVAAWWDLDAIAADYRGYLEVWGARAPRQPATPAAAFADYLLQLDRWRRIPFHDPGLPAAALPPDWPGGAAWTLFAELSERLGPAALEHVEARVGARARAA